MPKLKTNRGAAKRFRATASGFKARRSYRNHILTKKRLSVNANYVPMPKLISLI